MNLRERKSVKALAVFLVFALAQVYVQLSFAEPTPSNPSVPFPQNIIVARLTTTENRPITVNGASAITGSTILTGATITTPADTGASINLGALGSVDLAPGTTIRLEFDENGKLKVTLIVGCVIVKAKKKAEGELATEQNGTEKKTDKKTGGVIEACFPAGANAPTIGQGVAVGAGVAGGGGGGGGGIGGAAIAAIVAGIGGVVIGVPLAFSGRGGNPSDSTPSSPGS